MDPLKEIQKYFPEVIKQMNNRFNAHQFIRELSRQHQELYIKALAQYVDDKAPFQVVHGQLAKALYNFGDLVSNDGQENSTDIFGQSNTASVWIKR